MNINHSPQQTKNPHGALVAIFHGCARNRAERREASGIDSDAADVARSWASTLNRAPTTAYRAELLKILVDFEGPAPEGFTFGGVTEPPKANVIEALLQVAAEVTHG